MTMSKGLAFLLIGIATAICSLLLIPAASATEPNDAYSNATPISAGVWGPFDIDAGGDLDYYSFNVAEPSWVFLFVNCTSGNPALYLYDANVSYIDYDDDSGGYPYPLLEGPLYPGDYYVVVYDSSSTYNVSTYFLNLTIEAAQPIASGVYGPFDLNLSNMDDYYVFDVSEASNVRIEITGSSGDPLLYLYDMDSFSYYYDYDNNGGPGLFPLMTNQLYPGSYLIIAEMYSGSSVPGAYLNLSIVSLLGADGNGLMANATLVSLGTNGVFDITPYDDVDWYTITFAEAGLVTFETNGSSGYTYMVLYDQYGYWIGQDYSSGPGTFSWLAAVVTANPYYILVQTGYYMATVPDYNLTILQDVVPAPDLDDIPANASTLGVGTFGTYSIVNGDEDWYAFDAAEPGTLTVETNGVRGGASVDIYDDQQVHLAYGYSSGNESFEYASILVDTGRYLILVQGSYGAPAVPEYTVTITFVPYTSLDGNDFFSRRQTLHAGLNGPFSIEPYSDVDWYEFYNPVTGTATVDVYGGQGEVTLELQDRNGSYMSGGIYGYQTVSAYYAGTYVVRVQSTYGSYAIGRYYLNLSVVDTTDPVVTVSAPTDGISVDTGSVRVVGETEPGARVWVNGEEVFVDVNGSYEAVVVLAVGQNAITITSTDDAGNSGVTVVNVIGVDPNASLTQQLNNANAAAAAAQAAATAAQADAAAKAQALAAAQAAAAAAANASATQMASQNETLALTQAETNAARAQGTTMMLLAVLGFAAAGAVVALMMRKKPPMVAASAPSPIAPSAPVVVTTPAAPSTPTPPAPESPASPPSPPSA